MNPYAIIVVVAVIVFFALVLFTGKKIKEYAVYGVDGEILHYWRRHQNSWLEWGGNMVFYESPKADKKVIIQQHWIKRIKELENGEWNIIAQQISNKSGE